MASGRAYEVHEDEFIRAHWGRMSDRELARELGRSEVAITSRRSGLRLLRTCSRPKDRSMRDWTKEDDDAIRAMFEAGAEDEEMAIGLGRTIGAIAQRRSALRLLRKSAGRHEGLWSDEDDQILAWMFRHGWSDEKIGEAFDRTACAIKDRRQTLSLWRAPREER